jgi:glycosyltransferase involved in cell wall biosynthesis
MIDPNVQRHEADFRVRSEQSLPGVSVVICCYNSARRLPRTLEHLKAQVTSNGVDWELIIVDNGCTDETAAVARSTWTRGSVPLRVVNEAKRGLTNARTRGLREAHHELIVFVDDDNWLAGDWIQTAAELMSKKPEVGACGGQVEAACEEPPPAWFEEQKPSYAVGHQGGQDGDITWSRGELWGAGLCVRKSAWQQLTECGYRSFLTDREGNALSSGGDSELCLALRVAGWKLWFTPRLRMQHFIPREKLNWKYLRRLHRGFGASHTQLAPYFLCTPRGLPAIPPAWTAKCIALSLDVLRLGKSILVRRPLIEGDARVLALECSWGRLLYLLWNRSRYYQIYAEVAKLHNVCTQERRKLHALRLQTPLLSYESTRD